MKFRTHCSDLYVLPETKEEYDKVISFLEKIKWNWKVSYSNVRGQDWHGKNFIDVSFGSHLQEEISKL